MNNCSSNGLCVSPNNCECFDQYDGENCTEKVSVNLNSPVFSNESYSVVVSENRGKGFVILTVSANDSDHGRSGEISYSVEEASIANFFMISQVSGEITVAADGVLDYENIPQKKFTFIVLATDNGIPTRSSEATVTVTVKDENDNCPVFRTLPGNYKIPLQILAEDDDDGDNGHIDYSITEETDPDRKFFITSTGTLSANSILQPGAYLLTIVAQDRGVPPCPRELTLTILVDEIVSSIILPTSTFISFEKTSVMLSSHSSRLTESMILTSVKGTESVRTTNAETTSPEVLQATSILTKNIAQEQSPLQSSTMYPQSSSTINYASKMTLSPSSTLNYASSIALSPSKTPLRSSTVGLSLFLEVNTSFTTLPQSSTLNSSAIPPLQSSIVAPTQFSSQQSSIITVQPFLTLNSSAMAREKSSSLKASPSQQSRTTTVRASITLNSSAMTREESSSPKAFSSQQSRTTTVRPSLTLNSGAMTNEVSSSQRASSVTPEQSSSPQLDTMTTLQSSLSVQISASDSMNTPQLKPTKTSRIDSPISSTQATTMNNNVRLDIRILNIEFVPSYQDKTSSDYSDLRAMLEKNLLDVFEKMTGFKRISDVDFERGSVVAKIQTEFVSENTQVSSSSLARAVVQASDENGNLGELHFHIPSLMQQITPPTPSPTDEEDKEKDDSAYIGATVAIGVAGLVCVVLALCLVSI